MWRQAIGKCPEVVGACIVLYNFINKLRQRNNCDSWTVERIYHRIMIENHSFKLKTKAKCQRSLVFYSWVSIDPKNRRENWCCWAFGPNTIRLSLHKIVLFHFAYKSKPFSLASINCVSSKALRMPSQLLSLCEFSLLWRNTFFGRCRRGNVFPPPFPFRSHWRWKASRCDRISECAFYFILCWLDVFSCFMLLLLLQISKCFHSLVDVATTSQTEAKETF